MRLEEKKKKKRMMMLIMMMMMEDKTVGLARGNGPSTKNGQMAEATIDQPRVPRGYNEIIEEKRQMEREAAKAQLSSGQAKGESEYGGKKRPREDVKSPQLTKKTRQTTLTETLLPPPPTSQESEQTTSSEDGDLRVTVAGLILILCF